MNIVIDYIQHPDICQEQAVFRVREDGSIGDRLDPKILAVSTIVKVDTHPTGRVMLTLLQGRKGESMFSDALFEASLRWLTDKDTSAAEPPAEPTEEQIAYLRNKYGHGRHFTIRMLKLAGNDVATVERRIALVSAWGVGGGPVG